MGDSCSVFSRAEHQAGDEPQKWKKRKGKEAREVEQGAHYQSANHVMARQRDRFTTHLRDSSIDGQSQTKKREKAKNPTGEG